MLSCSAAVVAALLWCGPGCGRARQHDRRDVRRSQPLPGAGGAHHGNRRHHPVLAEPSRRVIGKPRITHAHWRATTSREPLGGVDRQGFDHCMPAPITDALGGAIAGRLIAYRLRGPPAQGRLTALLARRAGVGDREAEQDQRERLMRKRRVQRHDIDQRDDPERRLQQAPPPRASRRAARARRRPAAPPAPPARAPAARRHRRSCGDRTAPS